MKFRSRLALYGVETTLVALLLGFSREDTRCDIELQEPMGAVRRGNRS